MTATVCPHCGFDLETLRVLDIGDLHIGHGGAVVKWKGSTVSLRPCERLLLIAVVRADGAPVKRSALAEAMGYEGELLNYVAVQRCRMEGRFRKIDPAFDMIENVNGLGLRWKTDA